MKRSTITQAFLIGISLLSGVVLGASAALIASQEAKADKPQADYATSSWETDKQRDFYLPAQFISEERAAKEEALPPQF